MTAVLTVTLNPALDLTTEVAQVRPQHKLRCAPSQQHPGGGGINVARVLTRLGTPCRALFPVGGLTGQTLAALLQAEGVAQQALPIAGETRESFTVHETASGQDYRFVLPGPTLTPTEWQALLATIRMAASGVDVIVASGSLPPGAPEDALAQLAQLAHEVGTSLVVDTSGAPLRAALQEGVALIKPSLSELQGLTGEALATPADQLRAAHRLIQQGQTEQVALSLGSEGALLVNADAAWRAAALPVTVRSTVGAGDSFLAGLLWGQLEGLSPPEALACAMAAATAALLEAGTALCQPNALARLRPQVRVEAVPLPAER